jgi:hypothetical protein
MTDFNQDEVRRTIEGFNPKKAPGPDGITSDILTLVFKSIPKTTSIYNECLNRMEDRQDKPHCQTGKREQPRPLKVPPNKPAKYRR